MQRRSYSLLIFLAALALYSIAYLGGVASVPFHPDESTYIFTSNDVELFWQQPAALFWQADHEDKLLQHYRLLDAPLTNNLIAAGRWIAGEEPPPVDWDWGMTWQENQQAGALPSQKLLIAGRMSLAALFPFSLLLLFLTIRKTVNDFTAWTAVILLASNALALLHTRRAMAEGALVFTTTWVMWWLVATEKRPWLTALPTALAFCAKQTLAALMPVSLLAVIWQPGPWNAEKARRVAGQVLLFGVITAAVLALLNPFLWGQPVKAFQAAVEARQELARAQTADRPEQGLNTPGRKLISLVGSLFLTPPIFAETGNYLDDTRAAETAYLANPLNTLFRSVPAGGVLLILSLYGFVLGCIRSVRPKGPINRGMALLAAATLTQGLALLVLVPLPWQRYYMPLLPFTCLWTAYGIEQLRANFARSDRKQKQPA